ncbi:MAG: helix-hairpin-helix domain-containing protein [Planctomycetota bacterium]
MSQKKDYPSLQCIPGVGPAIARDLERLGYRSVIDLKNQDPQAMYDRLKHMQGGRLDRCVLYVFREAVYFASNETHDPERLKWWNWKDKK